MIEARGLEKSEGKVALERVSRRITALGHLYSKLSDPKPLRLSMQQPI